MITYRTMEISDCEAVERLYQMCFSSPWSLDAIREMFSVSGYCSLVAVEETGKLIGYVGMKAVMDEADITNVAVDPKMRGRGIAHELLQELLHRSREEGVHNIFLEVRASNIAAITLYDHAGFKECGLRKNYYTKPKEDALLMVYND